jgi:hypothetical protein
MAGKKSANGRLGQNNKSKGLEKKHAKPSVWAQDKKPKGADSEARAKAEQLSLAERPLAQSLQSGGHRGTSFVTIAKTFSEGADEHLRKTK